MILSKLFPSAALKRDKAREPFQSHPQELDRPASPAFSMNDRHYFYFCHLFLRFGQELLSVFRILFFPSYRLFPEVFGKVN